MRRYDKYEVAEAAAWAFFWGMALACVLLVWLFDGTLDMTLVTLFGAFVTGMGAENIGHRLKLRRQRKAVEKRLPEVADDAFVQGLITGGSRDPLVLLLANDLTVARAELDIANLEHNETKLGYHVLDENWERHFEACMSPLRIALGLPDGSIPELVSRTVRAMRALALSGDSESCTTCRGLGKVDLNSCPDPDCTPVLDPCPECEEMRARESVLLWAERVTFGAVKKRERKYTHADPYYVFLPGRPNSGEGDSPAAAILNAFANNPLEKH